MTTHPTCTSSEWMTRVFEVCARADLTEVRRRETETFEEFEKRVMAAYEAREFWTREAQQWIGL